MKYITTASLPLLLLGWVYSCTPNSLSDESTQAEGGIEFSTQVESTYLITEEEGWSKGTVIDYMQPLPSIGMFCYVTQGLWAADGSTAKPNKMNNVPLYSRKENADVFWDYEPDKEVTWQGVSYGANVAFFGYSPVATADNGLTFVGDLSAGGATTGAPVLRYTVPLEVTKQPDLLIAVPHKNLVRTANPIPLVYRRAAVIVGISLKGEGVGKVKGAYLKGVSIEGDVSLDIHALDTVRWRNLGPVSNEPLYFKLSTAPLPYPNASTLTEAPDGNLMMIPQRLTPQAMIVVEMDGEPDRLYSIAGKADWNPRTKVQYQINLSASTLSVEPADWMDAAADAGYVDVVVKSKDANWTAEVEGEGLSISKTESQADQTTVRISWADNKGPIEPGKRFGTITFKATKRFPFSWVFGQYEFHTSQLGQGPDWIEYNGVKWARGNLIANGPTGCKIGAPTDAGLYFRYGSLIGLKGGNDGTGAGRVDPAWSEKYWGGGTVLDMENEIAVCPSELLAVGGDGKPTNFTSASDAHAVSSWYFNFGGYPFNDDNTWYQPNLVSYRSHPGVVSGTYYKNGVGDPCSYYLGSDWETPTRDQWHSLCNNASGNPWNDASLIGAELEADPLRKENIYFAHRTICIPLSGIRNSGHGKFSGVGKLVTGGSPLVQYWATEARGTMNGWTFWYQWDFTPIDHFDIYASVRTAALPVRCVYNK